MKKIAIVLILCLGFLAPQLALAGEDAKTIESKFTIGKINSVPSLPDIWSSDLPTSVLFPFSNSYPCGYVYIPVKGLLKYSELADKANGVDINFSVWSGAGSKIGDTSIYSSSWNPVGPITQAKLFLCGKDVIGKATMFIETIYSVSTNGLLSRYVSDKLQLPFIVNMEEKATATPASNSNSSSSNQSGFFSLPSSPLFAVTDKGNTIEVAIPFMENQMNINKQSITGYKTKIRNLNQSDSGESNVISLQDSRGWFQSVYTFNWSVKTSGTFEVSVAFINRNGQSDWSTKTINFSVPMVSSKVDSNPLPATSKITIQCIKGKLIKKVTAVNPKCPTGYKKK